MALPRMSGTAANITCSRWGGVIVAHHTFAAGLSSLPILRGDVFSYRDRTLAAKRPDQFVWGAIPYFVLRGAGITYAKYYDRFSAGLFARRGFGAARPHDVAVLGPLPTCEPAGHHRNRFRILVVCLCRGGAPRCTRGVVTRQHAVLHQGESVSFAGCNVRLALVAGTLLGLVIFTSVLPALIVAVVGIPSGRLFAAEPDFWWGCCPSLPITAITLEVRLRRPTWLGTSATRFGPLGGASPPIT